MLYSHISFALAKEYERKRMAVMIPMEEVSSYSSNERYISHREAPSELLYQVGRFTNVALYSFIYFGKESKIFLIL